MSPIPAINRAVGAPVLLLPTGGAAAAALVAAAVTHVDPGAPILLMTGIAFLAGRTPERVTGLVVMGLFIGALIVYQVLTPGNDWTPDFMLPLTLFLAGLALRTRDVMTARLAAQAADIEAEREAYVQLSVRYERARIAAELHDVVAHAISLMVVQAGAGQRLAVSEPELADEALSVIATAARQAEEDLDRLADLLAVDTAGPDDDLLLVQEIVDRAGAAGLPVTLRLEGDSSAVRAVVAHTALRVVQEGLTNALRYAPGAPVSVTVRAGTAQLDLTVANARPESETRLNLGSGYGLTGLRERVAACGGTFDAGPDGDGGWHVNARLPR
jgi:signal transduction histidine kinase